MTARRFRIAGRVQGVGFRAFVASLARREELSGWVRNEPDGSGTAVAAGTEQALARFRSGIANGPPAARVAGVEESETAEPVAAGFRIA